TSVSRQPAPPAEIANGGAPPVTVNVCMAPLQLGGVVNPANSVACDGAIAGAAGTVGVMFCIGDGVVLPPPVIDATSASLGPQPVTASSESAVIARKTLCP